MCHLSLSINHLWQSPWCVPFVYLNQSITYHYHCDVYHLLSLILLFILTFFHIIFSSHACFFLQSLSRVHLFTFLTSLHISLLTITVLWLTPNNHYTVCHFSLSMNHLWQSPWCVPSVYLLIIKASLTIITVMFTTYFPLITVITFYMNQFSLCSKHKLYFTFSLYFSHFHQII